MIERPCQSWSDTYLIHVRRLVDLAYAFIEPKEQLIFKEYLPTGWEFEHV